MAIVKIYDDNNNSTSRIRGMLQTYDNDIICYLTLDIKKFDISTMEISFVLIHFENVHQLKTVRKIKIKSQFFYCEYENIPTVSKRVNKICKV